MEENNLQPVDTNPVSTAPAGPKPKFQVETLHDKNSFNAMITVHFMRHQKAPITWLYAFAIVMAGIFWWASAHGDVGSIRALSTGLVTLVVMGLLVKPLDKFTAKLVVKRMVKKSVKATKEIGTPIRYRFYEDDMDAAGAEECNSLAYTEAKDLVETHQFFLVYMKSAQCYILSKEHFKIGAAKDFPAFLAKKTGLTWAPYEL